jgi:hypothetical protein
MFKRILLGVLCLILILCSGSYENVSAATTAPTRTYSKIDIDRLKLYSKIQYQYYLIESLGNDLFTLSDNMFIQIDRIDLGKDPYVFATINDSVLSNVIETQKQLSVSTTNLVKIAKNSKIDISTMLTMLQKYNTTIEYFKKAMVNLKHYETYKDDYSSSQCETYLADACEIYVGVPRLAKEQGKKYYEIIQKY